MIREGDTMQYAECTVAFLGGASFGVAGKNTDFRRMGPKCVHPVCVDV